MTNKNDTLAFDEYPAIKLYMGKEEDCLVGSDLEPMFVFDVFGALISKCALASRQLPKNKIKQLDKNKSKVDIEKLTFEHHDKHIAQFIKNVAAYEIAVCKHHNLPFRYVKVTAIGDYSHYSIDEAIEFPVGQKHFGNFLTLVDDFTCKLRIDGSMAMNWVKLKSGEEFFLAANTGPFYMDGITLCEGNLRMFKDMITKYKFTEVDVI